MRLIRKCYDGGYHLNCSQSNPPQTSNQAISRWRSFGHKEMLLQSLLAEQYQLCCYSELRADEEGFGYHIEHVENKSQNPQRTFDYKNLAASAFCCDDLHTLHVRGEEVFGGHAPGKNGAKGPVDIYRFIPPHRPDCERFFVYVSDGRVLPAIELNLQERDQALYTIDILNLNSPYLITRRRQWWDELDELFQEHTEKQWNLPDLVKIILTPTSGKLFSFISLTRQFFAPLAEQMLQQKMLEMS